MAALLPRLDGVFVQAVSEVATINHLYGAGGAGVRSMTFTSSPGFSLMLEGISYLIGAEVPAVIVNVMRGGPGLGNIGPTQSDVSLMCRGLGHGDTHSVVLAPSTPQEMLDLTYDAFRIAFEYRNPVIVAPDGYLGQMTGRVRLPQHLVQPGLPSWAVTGDAEHRKNLICSIALSERELEDHNFHLQAKYQRMIEREARAELVATDDASIVLIAATTVARMARGAVKALRAEGIRAGLFRPITLWPFPTNALSEALGSASRVLVVEASCGQLRDEVRLALADLGITDVEVESLWHTGGVLPSTQEIISRVSTTMGVWT
jgi:pyruvate/2-oxoacid:ferredoxin oxidoreductase alpha subunit